MVKDAEIGQGVGDFGVVGTVAMFADGEALEKKIFSFIEAAEFGEFDGEVGLVGCDFGSLWAVQADGEINGPAVGSFGGGKISGGLL